MLVSFFDNWEFVTGIDYQYIKGSPEIQYQPATPESPEILFEPAIPDQWRIDCVGVYDIDFDPRTQTVSLVKGEVIIEDIT
mgnify:FL=1